VSEMEEGDVMSRMCVCVCVPTVGKIHVAIKHARTMHTLTLQTCLWCLSLAQGTSWHL